MSLLDWLTRSANRDLERRVTGTGGTAQGRYEGLLDDHELLICASIGNGHQGRIAIRVRPAAEEVPEAREEGQGEVVLNLGPGQPFRGASVEVEAEVIRDSPAPLGALAVEILERPPGVAGPTPDRRDTFSVESRFDENGRAALRIDLQLVKARS